MLAHIPTARSLPQQPVHPLPSTCLTAMGAPSLASMISLNLCRRIASASDLPRNAVAHTTKLCEKFRHALVKRRPFPRPVSHRGYVIGTPRRLAIAISKWGVNGVDHRVQCLPSPFLPDCGLRFYLHACGTRALHICTLMIVVCSAFTTCLSVVISATDCLSSCC